MNNPTLLMQESRVEIMGKKRAEYRCVATSIEGFVQQVAVQYLRHGYWFYVAGRVPDYKDPRAVDAKLIKKYGIDVSRSERARRKRAGLANMQYICHDRFFLLMATHGQHRFFEEEADEIRDARRVSIKYAGYSLSFRNGRVCVRIDQEEYKRLKSLMLDLACRRTADRLASTFWSIPYEPYAPVRQQLLQIWRAVNRARNEAGCRRVPIECVRWKRRTVRAFEEPARVQTVEESSNLEQAA